MKRLFFILVILFTQANVLFGLTYREFLNAWVGSWQGVSTVYNETGAPLQLIKVEQNFWWDGDVLRGMTQFWSDYGAIQSQSQFIRYKDGALSNEVVFSSGNKRVYHGDVEEGFLVWTWENKGLRFRIATKVVGSGDNREMQEECHQLVQSDVSSQLRHIITTLNVRKSKEPSLPRNIPDIKDLKSRE